MRPVAEDLHDNSAWTTGAARLSVLIPFFKDDPSDLLAALSGQVADVEIILLDDGSRDPALTERVARALHASPFPARLVTLSANQGRSKGRNRLAAHARANHFLFLDSDMAPGSAQFLQNWLSLITQENPAVAFGGFSLEPGPSPPEHALHRELATGSDCLTATQRATAPEKYVYTSNLLVRRDVFEAEAFDAAFAGWGWEDVEWGIRVARRWPIRHVDNPATHVGLETAAALAGKYEQSTANFARVVGAHREVVARYPVYRVARALRRMPLRSAWRPALKAIALSEGAPMRSRALAMRLYRAALYAEVV